MRADLESLLRDVTLLTLAFAIALGWSLFQVASGLGYLVVGAFQDYEGSPPGGLSFELDGHAFVFEPLVSGLVEFLAILALILLVRRRFGAETKFLD